MNPKTKFKQPILFKSRVIDLSDIEAHIDGYAYKAMSELNHFSSASKLFTYFLMFADADPLCYEQFIEDMKEHFNIDLKELKYGKLPRPLALDLCTGDLHQIASIDYNRSGEVSSVIVRDGDALKYIYNAIPEHSWIPAEALKTELQIMYDGWQ